jgi:hypothetical protein
MQLFSGHTGRKSDFRVFPPTEEELPEAVPMLAGDNAGHDLIKPAPATRDRCDECSSGLGTDRSTVLDLQRRRHDDLAPPFH